MIWGPGALAAADDLLGDGYTLLSTARATERAPHVAERATEVFEVPQGPVEDVAGDLLGAVRARRLVAMGGGRVIDTAKALAAGAPGIRVTAIPTTLSGAEMTRLHRVARGLTPATPRARASVVVNDPALSASAQDDRLAASSANALGHALTALAADNATAHIAAQAAAAVRLIAGAWAREQPDRDGLALGGMLAGDAVDRTGLGLHHVLAQTAARRLGIAHASANAAVLVASTEALEARRPALFASLLAAAGVDARLIARVLRARAGANALVEVRRDPQLMGDLLASASARPEIGRTAPTPEREEIEGLYLQAADPLPVPDDEHR